MMTEQMSAVVANTLYSLRSFGPLAGLERDMIAKALELQIQSHQILAGVAFTPEEIARMQAELEARLAVSIGNALDLVDDVNHKEWYFGDRRKPGPFTDRYFRRLVDKGWPIRSLESLQETTARVLELMEDPERPAPWNRRGLVVGHVQSGKTAHYTGVICRAADAGYRIIVVLAGMHNLLRKQTQVRLDEDFLGFDTNPERPGATGGRKPIGVGLGDPSPQAQFVTTSAMNGDFNKRFAASLGFTPQKLPWLFVLKKNASVLKALNSWIDDLRQRSPASLNEPLLVIDDEADQASIDTNQQEQLDDETFDEDYEPTRINGEIRRLLDAFSRSAYVAYTATPFANILIHDARRAREFGADLFPSGFIINLPAPSNYMGPRAIFGLDDDGEAADQAPLPVVRSVDQTGEEWIVPGHRKDYHPLYAGEDRIPPSLEKALRSFILARAARVARGQGFEHASMLVHVSRFTNVHQHVSRQVKEWFDAARRALQYGGNSDFHKHLERLWRDDFEPTTEQILSTEHGRGLRRLAWDEVRECLPEAVERVQPVVVNRDTKTPLDYDNYKEKGLHVIAVGGDKLSRGLTLEGLVVSYFLRTSTLYDTLMQMGRWFGYRNGYGDLCRLYLTGDLDNWFRHVATASEELRAQFNHMALTGATPKDYGLKIASHDVLAVTAANKMRSGQEVAVSFAGQIKIQTLFEVAQLAANVRAVSQFLQDRTQEAIVNPRRPDGSSAGGVLWRGVPGRDVADLLKDLSYAAGSFDVNERLGDYVAECLAGGELTTWTVFLAEGEGGPKYLDKRRVETVSRQPIKDRPIPPGLIAVRTILSPADEAIDLTPAEYEAALIATRARKEKEIPGQAVPDRPSGPEIREQRGRDPARGLLIVYPLSPEALGISADAPIVGVVVSFPTSPKPRTVAYVVNSVTRRLELRR